MLMVTPTAAPPPIGTVGIGELLADAQTKTIWLGVDAVIDPAQAILLADMLAVETGFDQTLDDAKAYTDDQIATRAPLVHTHEISDINGLTEALGGGGAGGIPVGCILIWHGNIIDIPAGWVICDGMNGTPDLKDKFVLGGGGGRTIGSTGGSFTLSGNTGAGGAHDHGGYSSYYALLASEMPPHNHGYSDPGHVHSVYDPSHTHPVPYGGNQVALPIGGASGGLIVGTAGQVAGAAYTGISLYGAACGITIASAGGGNSHRHPIPSQVDHTHPLTSVSTLPPYYVLAYIMRIG